MIQIIYFIYLFFGTDATKHKTFFFTFQLNIEVYFS